LQDTTEAVEVYEQDKFSRSSAAARLAFERTWREYHMKATTKTPGLECVAMFPLDPAVVKVIAALMKLDGFRSFPNYLSWAKTEHIKLGHGWSLQLELEAKQGARSVARGLGQARQMAAFDVATVAAAPQDVPIIATGCPVFPADMAVLGAYWVLREIEIAWATRSDVIISDKDSTVSWYLPVSKTDPRAKACYRNWGCLCTRLPVSQCPFHRMKNYLNKMDDFLKLPAGDDPAVRPLFPDSKGKVAKKEGVIKGLEGVLATVGVRVRDVQGRRRFGGHSMRISGSRFWATQGLEVYKIQIFARWGSATVLRYVADTPIANLTGEMASSSGSSIACPDRSIASLLSQHIRYAEEQLETLRAEIARLDRAIAPSYVQNVDTKAWHHVLTGGLSVPVTSWRTICGWPYGKARYSLSPDAPAAGARFCGTCLRMAADGMVLNSSSASDESDSA